LTIVGGKLGGCQERVVFVIVEDAAMRKVKLLMDLRANQVNISCRAIRPSYTQFQRVDKLTCRGRDLDSPGPIKILTHMVDGSFEVPGPMKLFPDVNALGAQFTTRLHKSGLPRFQAILAGVKTRNSTLTNTKASKACCLVGELDW
jgi:hypothetical protein